MVSSFLKKLFSPAKPAASKQSTEEPVAKSPPAVAPAQSYYGLDAIRCMVLRPAERYERPNADRSHIFKGTTLHAASIPNKQPLTLSFEGLFDIADQGDALSVVFAKYEIEGFAAMKSTLPVLVVNSNTKAYHLVTANIEKCASPSKGGEAQLNDEIRYYASTELKVTFV